MEARLKVVEGPARGSVLSLQPGETRVLGRGPGADLVLADPGLAPAHAACVLSPEGLSVVDLGGPGGTLLNDEALPTRVPREAWSGDELRLGATLVRLTVVGRGLRRERREVAEERALLPPEEFQDLREIGAGAAGKVYAGRWAKTGGWVAIKILREEIVAGSPDHERFLRECSTVARLQSPYVVAVYDLRVHQGRAYTIMELVSGPSARERLSASGPYSVPEALRVGEDVAHALAAAAEQGVVHRDVKPANILLSSRGVAKLCDFGIAKDLDSTLRSLTLSGAGLGTLAYLPPEQVQEAKHVEPSADVYSLGATLYHLLSGRLPFDPQSPADLARVLSEAPPSLAALRPDAPPDVIGLVEAMLAKDPARRPPIWRLSGLLPRVRQTHYPQHSFEALFPAPTPL